MPTVNNGSVELAYDVVGDGPPLLLIAGTSADRGLWGYVRPQLASRFRTIAFDNRDVGSSSIADSVYSIEDLASDALAVLDAEGAKDAHVLGHSMGGQVAQVLALSHPDRVRSLTLANTWAQSDINSRSAFELARDLTLAIEDDELRLRALYFMGLGPSTLSSLPLSDVAAGVIAAGPLQPREALARQWRLNLILDTLDRLGAISAPTHVIWSEADRFFPEQHARQLAGGISSARVTMIGGGVGHCPMVENPDMFIGVVLPFLDELESAAATA